MAFTAIKKLFSGVRPIIALSILMLASLVLLNDATNNSAHFGQIYTLMLTINLAAIFLLIVLIIKNIYFLFIALRKKVTGSILTFRLVILFVVLSVTPVMVVYSFSLDFLKRGIDSWFNVGIETALKDALELSRASLGLRMNQGLHDTQQISNQLLNVPDDLTLLNLNDMRSELGALELTLFDHQGEIIAASSSETSTLVPERLDIGMRTELQQTDHYTGLSPVAGFGYHIRIAIKIPNSDPLGQPRILLAIFTVTEHINALTDSVAVAIDNFKAIAYLRDKLKNSFILTLSLVLFLTLLMAIWVAFFYARRLVQPISDLVDGTKAVAAGNYKTQLPVPVKDELGFLVQSFNEMTERISLVSEEATRSQQQLAEQHAYLEIVLAHLSSGVITLDQQRRLHTSNSAASQIIGVNFESYEGFSLDKITHEQPQVLLFIDMIFSQLDNNESEWQEEMVFFNTSGRQVLLCRGSALPSTYEDRSYSGHIIVFDDITNLVQAQRNAAWGEVARRLAHEIKNPLTPIQLSADRLRHKYLKTMDKKDAEVLDRSTHTIIQQVETLKEMVKAFSDYARMPELTLVPTNINKLIHEVLDLYRNEQTACKIDLQLDETTPIIDADNGRLRQLLHNLIKNALEAMRETDDAELYITSKCMEKEACRFIELRIHDNGPGIPDDILPQLFEPYVTSKPKGTGLGLAIVKKIVEEHGGMIWAENLDNGACMVMRLPVSKDQTETLESNSSKTRGNTSDVG